MSARSHTLPTTTRNVRMNAANAARSVVASAGVYALLALSFEDMPNRLDLDDAAHVLGLDIGVRAFTL